MGRYEGGRIKRLKIRNFMTYDDIEISPKDGLNLIVGLNGSGKSSIMCAICLGLAGKPQFTGRASTLSDFIKHGESQAEIEIELENVKGKNIVINRKIRGGEKCEWHLNKRISSQNEVIATVKKLNIDTSNLCQFLPQEKVSEFSRMDKKQRLENMLQAIGEPRLFELFSELKHLHKCSIEIENAIKKSKQAKSCDEEKNDRISVEVQKQETRLRQKKELEDLFNMQTIVQYKEIHAEVNELKREKNILKMSLRAVYQERDDAVAKETAILTEYKKHSGQLNTLKSKGNNLFNEIEKERNSLMSHNEQAHNAKIEYENRMKEKESQKKRLRDVTLQIDSLEKLLQEEMINKDEIQQKVMNNIEEMTKLHAEITELNKQIEKVQLERNSYHYSFEKLKKQLAEMKDEQNKKMNILKKLDKYTYEAVCWLTQNQNTFRARVFLPIMLEIKVHSSENCKYVENHIALRDMLAFVCEDKEDCKRLTNILKNQMNLPVNIVMEPGSLPDFKQYILTPQLRQYGLECFLSDLFTAPEPVMRYLYSCFQIQRIPVAKSAIDKKHTDSIIKTFRIFFSGNTKVVGKRSRYGNKNWCVKTEFIVGKNWLVNIDDERQKEVEKKLQDIEMKLHDLTAMNLKKNVLEKEQILEQLRQEKKNLAMKQNKIQNLSIQLTQRKSFRQQMTVAIHKEEEKSKVTEKVQYINKAREKELIHVNELLKEYNKIQREIIKQCIHMNCLSKELKLKRAANETFHEKVKEQEKKFYEASAIYQEKKNKANELLDKVKKLKNTVHTDDLINFIEAPSVPLNLESAEVIEEKINHLQAELDLNEDNEPLLREYEERKKKIATVEATIDKYQNDLNSLKELIEKKKKEWLKPLQYHISNINKKFSKYFKYLSCAGEINLDIPDNSEDFASYGLQIKLKYREDEPLTELSQTHHSGGECSVAAIVFILSLQELTEVPFRCIDEINQGMDSINERKIYQLIADSVGDDKCSQYFLLTPKLLMDLQYPDDVAVHVIHNSSFLNIKLDIKKLLKVAESL